MASRTSTCLLRRASNCRMTITLQNSSSSRKPKTNLCWRKKRMGMIYTGCAGFRNWEGETRRGLAGHAREILGPVGSSLIEELVNNLERSLREAREVVVLTQRSRRSQSH